MRGAVRGVARNHRAPKMTATHKVIRAEFWGKQVDHIDLGGDDVRIVLEDAPSSSFVATNAFAISRATPIGHLRPSCQARNQPRQTESVCATPPTFFRLRHPSLPS